MHTRTNLEVLKRAEVVKIAKCMGIKANGKTVTMIASILEQQVEVDQVEAVVKETPQKTETENGAGWASPELREMSYNEVRSIAKNTPGVKAKGSKVDLIAAIAAINEVVEVETAPVAVDSPKVFMTGDECGEDECIKELEKLMLADLYEEEEADSEVWDMLKSQEIAKDISNESMTEEYIVEEPKPVYFSNKENTARNKNKKMSNRNKKKLKEKKLMESQKIEITRSCFLSPNSFAKLQTGNAPRGMTANEAEGGVFSPASRANANVLKDLLGV